LYFSNLLIAHSAAPCVTPLVPYSLPLCKPFDSASFVLLGVAMFPNVVVVKTHALRPVLVVVADVYAAGIGSLLLFDVG
jgi:hypothetical protein